MPARRLDGTLDVRDFGASCNGVTDDHAALVAAQTAGQRSAAAEIVIPPGCKLNLNGKLVYTVGTNSWRYGVGSRIVSGGIQGLLSQSTTNGVTYSKATALDANENSVAAYGLYNVSLGTASYQKNGFYTRVTSHDPSSYRLGTLIDSVIYAKDLVGYEAQTSAAAGNRFARLYGYHTQVTFPAGSDGNSWAAEFETSNAGTYTAQQGKFNSKGAMHLTNVGTNDMTVALDIDGGPGHFANDITGWQRSTRRDGWFLYYGTTPEADMALPPIFGVAHDGRLTASSAVIPDFAGPARFEGPVTLTTSAVFADTRQRGNHAFARGGFELLSTNSNIVAGGGTRRSAPVLGDQVNILRHCPAGAGISLPDAPSTGTSLRISVLNRSGTSCTVYPASGARIEGNSPDAGITLRSGADGTFTSDGPSQWYR